MGTNEDGTVDSGSDNSGALDTGSADGGAPDAGAVDGRAADNGGTDDGSIYPYSHQLSLDVDVHAPSYSRFSALLMTLVLQSLKAIKPYFRRDRQAVQERKAFPSTSEGLFKVGASNSIRTGISAAQAA